MNLEILEKLMEDHHITSYYKLAKFVDIPYTTLLDLVHNKGLKVTTIKTIADFFNVTVDLLISPTTYYNVIVDDESIESYIPLTKEQQNHLFYLLKS